MSAAARLRGERLRRRLRALVDPLPSGVLVELHELTSGGVQCSSILLGCGSGAGTSPEAAETRTQWVLDSIGGRGWGVELETRGEVTQISTRGIWGKRWFVLAAQEVGLALSEVTHGRGLSVSAVGEIAWYGEEWAAVCAALRDTSVSPWRSQSLAITETWPHLDERAREVVVGLAPSWEGSSSELFAIASEL